MASLLYVSLSPLLSLIRTLVIGFRTHLNHPECSHVEILNFITSAKTHFPEKSNSQVLEVRACTYLLRGDRSPHYTSKAQVQAYLARLLVRR